MPATRLPPAEWFPAGWPGLSARRVALADGTSIRVVEAGAPDGKPVLLIHGWAVSAYLWRHTLGALAAAGYRAIAPDLTGHGLSDAPTTRGEYTLDKFASRLEMLLDTWGVGPAPILAQSLGGRIGFELAMRGRATKLVLFGPVGFGEVTPARAFAPFIPERLGDLATSLVTRQMVEVVQRRVQGKLSWFTERDVDEYWAPTQFPAVVRAQVQMLREFSWNPLTAAELAAMTVETLVIFGTEDRTVKPGMAQQQVERLPYGRILWIEDAGHVVMEEVPERTNALLVEFLGSAG